MAGSFRRHHTYLDVVFQATSTSHHYRGSGIASFRASYIYRLQLNLNIPFNVCPRHHALQMSYVPPTHLVTSTYYILHTYKTLCLSFNIFYLSETLSRISFRQLNFQPFLPLQSSIYHSLNLPLSQVPSKLSPTFQSLNSRSIPLPIMSTFLCIYISLLPRSLVS